MSNENTHIKTKKDVKPCLTAEKLAQIKKDKADKVTNQTIVQK